MKLIVTCFFSFFRMVTKHNLSLEIGMAMGRIKRMTRRDPFLLGSVVVVGSSGSGWIWNFSLRLRVQYMEFFRLWLRVLVTLDPLHSVCDSFTRVLVKLYMPKPVAQVAVVDICKAVKVPNRLLPLTNSFFHIKK